MDLDNKAELKIWSCSKNIGLARLAAASFASQLEFTLTEIEEIKMAISEAVTNSIVHGYGQEKGWIKLEMGIKDRTLILELTDWGKGLTEEKGEKEQDVGGEGLGLIFIRNFMDQVDIESHPGQGTKVKMSLKAGRESRTGCDLSDEE